MALTATLYHVSVELSNVDRGVYTTLEVKLARHPSESVEYMVARLLAYCLEYTEGIAFSEGGVSSGDEPAVLVRDLTGKIVGWIEVGLPDWERLHRAAKIAERVVVYTHRDPRQLVAQLEGKRIHRREEMEIWALDRSFVAELGEGLDRRTSISLSVTEGHLYAGIGGRTLSAVLEPVSGNLRR